MQVESRSLLRNAEIDSKGVRVTAPIYIRVARDLQERIATGDLAPGETLPSTHDLAEQYGMAPATAARALAVLVREGQATVVRGVGHTVRDRGVLDWPLYDFEQLPAQQDAWVAAMEAQGYQAKQDIRVEIVEATDTVGDRLRLTSGDLVVIRHRRRFVRRRDGDDWTPIALAHSHFPEHVVRSTAIMHPADITTGGRHILTERGHEMVRHSDEIMVRQAEPEEARQLGLSGTNAAVIVHLRTSEDAEGTPVRVMTNILPADRYRLLYRLEN